MSVRISTVALAALLCPTACLSGSQSEPAGGGGAPVVRPGTGGSQVAGTGGAVGVAVGSGGSSLASTGGAAAVGAAGLGGPGAGGRVASDAGGRSGSGGATSGATSGGTSGATTGGTSGQSGPVTHNEVILYDDAGSLLYINNSTPSKNWTARSGSGRDMQIIGGGKILLGRGDGWDEYRLSDGMLMGGQHGFAGTQSVHRLADGTTMLASVTGNSIVLKMVTAAGQVQRMVTYAGYSYVRLVRPTAAGTFMVTADTVVFEGDDTGKVLWNVTPPGGDHVWKAMRLANGNTAITTGYGATLVIYNPAKTVIQTIGKMPSISAVVPKFFADFHVMPNGNYFVVNSQADGSSAASVQMLEFDTGGALVWQQKQPASVRSLEAGYILDGVDATKLHVEPAGVVTPAPAVAP